MILTAYAQTGQARDDTDLGGHRRDRAGLAPHFFIDEKPVAMLYPAAFCRTAIDRSAQAASR
jgi:hypothetical protein